MRAVWLLALGFVGSGSALAEPTGVFDAVVDNDATHDTDRYYSNGFQLAGGFALRPDLWLVLRGVHEIYTPEEFRSPAPRPGDRPYAGLLYGRFALHLETDTSFHLFGLTAGVAGPSAGGHAVQLWSHRIMDEPRPKGWATQLPDRLIAGVSWEGAAFQEFSLGSQVHFSIHGLFGAEAGSLRVKASSGAGMFWGVGVEAADGVSMLTDSLGLVRRLQGFGIGLAAGAIGHAIGEDHLIEGRQGVTLIPVVGEFRFGIAIAYDAFRLRYVHVLTTPEFESQLGVHGYGSFRLSMGF